MDNDENKIRIQAKILFFLSIAFLIGAVLTIIPFGTASKANIIGYKSLCTFTPVSTIICFLASRTFYTLWKRKTGKEPGPNK